jgi:RNA polymerase subunit RPABC4/transcription elongation factor Spt4
MKICPACKSNRLHYSHGRSRPEIAWRNLTGRHIYRCQQCNWRGLRVIVKKNKGFTSIANKKLTWTLYMLATVIVLIFVLYIAGSGSTPPPPQP